LNHHFQSPRNKLEFGGWLLVGELFLIGGNTLFDSLC